MDNFNINEDSINKLKNIMNNGDISNVISQIPPEMLQNFSQMMNSNQNNKSNENNNNNNVNSSNSNNSNNNTSTNNQTSNSNTNNFDFSKIDMNTMMKIKSIMEKMNSGNDPRNNLLNSLKPYLREGKKEKLDQYANLMNVAKIAELFNNKENNNNA